jgi:hypothetical protein
MVFRYNRYNRINSVGTGNVPHRPESDICLSACAKIAMECVCRSPLVKCRHMSVRARENRAGVCLFTRLVKCLLGSPFDNSSRLLSDMLTSCVMCYGILFIQFLKSGGRVVSLQRTKDSLPYVHELHIPKMLNLL